MEKCLLYHLCCFLLLSSICSSFNVDDTPSASKFIYPYSEGLNQKLQNPIFFGYTFDIQVSESTITVGSPKRNTTDNDLPQVDRPSTQTTGDIWSCQLPLSLPKTSEVIPTVTTASVPTRCESINLPPNSTYEIMLTNRTSESMLPNRTYETLFANTAFGQIISSDNGKGSLKACSPTRVKVCGRNRIEYRMPGYCYIRDSNTNTWRKDPQTLDIRCPPLGRDIIFVIDGSGSVEETNFKVIQQWIINLAANFNINDGTNKIGVIQYSHFYDDRSLSDQRYIKTEIGLDNYTTQRQFDEAVNNIQYDGFTTYTAAALRKTALDFKASPRFNDPNTAKVMILLTDGNSSDSNDLPRDARNLRELGVTTFAVGVSNAIEKELRTVATGDINSSQRVFFVTNFTGLQDITNQLASEISITTLEGSQNASMNNRFALAEYGFSLQRAETV